MRRADRLARSLGVVSVPTIVVDSRYVVVGQGASVDSLRIAEMLIERARAERHGPVPLEVPAASEEKPVEGGEI